MFKFVLDVIRRFKGYTMILRKCLFFEHSNKSPFAI